MAEQLGPFIGAGRDFKYGVLSLSQFVNAGAGTVTVFALRPEGAKLLVVNCQDIAVRIKVGDYRVRDFETGDVDTGANTLTLTGEIAFGVAAGVVVPDPYKLTTTTTLPAGLTLTKTYILRVLSVSPDVVALYDSDADARADVNRVNMTDVGVGTHTIGGIQGQAASTVSDGSSEFEIDDTLKIYVFDAPARITFKGKGINTRFNYYWL